MDRPVPDAEQLRRLLRDVISRDASISQPAIQSLREMERERLFSTLVDLLRAGNLSVYRAFAGMLEVERARAVTTLVSLIEDANEHVRYNVCGYLGDVGDERVVEPLARRLLRDPSDEVRLLAAFSLGKLASRRALAALRHARTHDNGRDYEGRTIREAAHEAIQLTLAWSEVSDHRQKRGTLRSLNPIDNKDVPDAADIARPLSRAPGDPPSPLEAARRERLAAALRRGRGEGAQLVGADLHQADLSRARLAGADLTDADLAGAGLWRAELVGATLVGARLAASSAFRADLREADLTGADLRRAAWRRARLADAVLDRANLQRASLDEADFSRARLAHADLSLASLERATLAGVDARGADFRDANLWCVDLAGANLEGADLTYSNVTATQLGTAASLRGATLPDGSQSGD